MQQRTALLSTEGARGPGGQATEPQRPHAHSHQAHDRVSQALCKNNKLNRFVLTLSVFQLEVRAKRATRETGALRAISTGRLRRPCARNT